MKTAVIKLVLLGLYLTAITLAWSKPVLVDGVFGLTVKGVLSYCGIIVLFQLFAALLQLWRWFRVLKRANGSRYAATPVVVKTEAN